MKCTGDVAKERLTESQHYGIHVDAVFVNQVELHKCLCQHGAAEKPDVFAGLLFDGVDFFRDVVLNQHGIVRIAPVNARECARNHDFGGIVQPAGVFELSRCAGWIARHHEPVTCHTFIGPASPDDGIRQVMQGMGILLKFTIIGDPIKFVVGTSRETIQR